MSLDPQAQKLLDNAAALNLAPLYSLPVAEARERQTAGFISIQGQLEPVHKIEDITIPWPGCGVPVRVYTPGTDSFYPILVFYHGGGWVLNNVDTHDAVCRSLANQVGCIVISVDYRLSPEHKYPAAIEDAYVAYRWAQDNVLLLGGDPNKIAVGGDSSGGNQAAVVCLLARDQNCPPPKFQWLVYPVTDYYLPGTQSYRDMASGYSLNRDFMIWFWNNYLPNDISLDDPYICPLRSQDLSGLPPAIIMTANFDPLRDEGELYAKRLEETGIPVTLKRFEDQMHGFLLQRENINRARDAFQYAVDELRRAFNN